MNRISTTLLGAGIALALAAALLLTTRQAPADPNSTAPLTPVRHMELLQGGTQPGGGIGSQDPCGESACKGACLNTLKAQEQAAQEARTDAIDIAHFNYTTQVSQAASERNSQYWDCEREFRPTEPERQACKDRADALYDERVEAAKQTRDAAIEEANQAYNAVAAAILAEYLGCLDACEADPQLTAP